MRFLFLFILLVCFGGCAKDLNKDIPNPGISFLYGGNGKNTFTLRPSTTPQKITGLLVVNLRDANPASADIQIKLADNTAAILSAYNTANGTSIQPFPTALLSIPSELVIKKGEQHALGEIVVSSTSALDFNKEYGIGVSITGVSNGRKVAEKLGDIFIVCRVLNLLDGRYKVRGQYYHPSLGNIWNPHITDSLELWTTGPDNVKMVWPANYPQIASPQGGLYLNPITNTVNVYNDAPAGVVVSHLPSYNGNTYNNRYDSVTRIIYIAYGYNFGTGFTFIPLVSRAWIDTLTYLGPR